MRSGGHTILARADATVIARIALWGMLAAKVWGAWGLTWDIQWHMVVGRDSLWVPPHLMMYSAGTAILTLSLGGLAATTSASRRGRGLAGSRHFLGFVGTPGMHLAWWGVVVFMFSVPIDDLWHRLFGLDVTVWSPPHLLALLGVQVNSAGCLALAVEVYPAPDRRGLVATLIAGALLFGVFHLLIGPSLGWAYDHGGFFFFLYPILGSFLLPLALVPAARLSRSRWAPALTVVVAALVALSGGTLARAGFALVNPESHIEEALRDDPDSPLAKAHEMARANNTPVVTSSRAAAAIGLTLLPAVLLGFAGARFGSLLGGVLFGATYVVLSGWSLSRLSMLHDRLPTATDAVGAVALCVMAGALGGSLGRVLADALVYPSSGSPASRGSPQ